MGEREAIFGNIDMIEIFRRVSTHPICFNAKWHCSDDMENAAKDGLVKQIIWERSWADHTNS